MSLLEKNPGFEPARLALACLEKAPIAKPTVQWMPLLVVAGLSLVALLMFGLWPRLPVSEPGLGKAVIEQSPQARVAKKELLAPTPEPRPPMLPDVPGIVQRTDGGFLVVNFEQPLFTSDDQLEKDAKKLLARLAEKLKGTGEELEIHVIGFSRPVESSKGKAASGRTPLAFRRAIAVIGVVQEKSGLALERFSARSGGEKSDLATDDKQGRLDKDRTVVIKIRQIQEKPK
ncbi:MAG: OmpA family protein [Verrucomicrobia bacterium]|nr:OmpA family protein [Verrucomicrobiota bacterium]